MSNQVTNFSNSVKGLLNMEVYQKRFKEVLGSRSSQFMSSIISAINSNGSLNECEPNTVIQSALKAAILDLPIEDNFGFAYLVPYYNGKKKIKECQFQLGYKGYIQLALRTGLYEKLNVMDVRKGELKKWNPLIEDLEIEFNPNEEERKTLDIIGYAGYFKLINGFNKVIYWSIESLEQHGKKYSAQYSKYGSGNWKDNFNEMAKKTVIKNMINKWGILSVEMQTPNKQLLDALRADQAVIRGEEEYDYVDNDFSYTLEDSESEDNENKK